MPPVIEVVMIEGNPQNDVFQVRLLIGDTQEEFIADNIIAYVLDKNNNDLYKTALEVLEYIVSNLSSEVDHKVGGESISASKLYKQKKQLLKDLKSNTMFSKREVASIYIGGTLQSEVDRVIKHEDSVLPPIASGFSENGC